MRQKALTGLPCNPKGKERSRPEVVAEGTRVDISERRQRSVQLSMRKSAKTRSPSFLGLRSSSLASTSSKQANRHRDTVPELLLRRALSRLGLRYRVYSSHLPGRPDIVFPKAKLAIFCDGDFWHGRNWNQLRETLSKGHNSSYWTAKVAANRTRDQMTNRILRKKGWRVVRMWEADIKRDPNTVALQVRSILRSKD